MKSQEDKIKIIYIVSNGRSGSTLLESLLGSQNNIWTLGEFQMLPMELEYGRQKCACGELVPNCTFWTKIVKKVDYKLGSINLFRNDWSGKVLRGKWLFKIFISRSFKNESHTYAKDNEIVLKEAFNQIEKNDVTYLVDSSKDFYRLALLKNSDLFDIKVIHIVKKPEAFVYSMTKDSAFSYLNLLNKTIRFSMRWIIENILIKMVINSYFNKNDVCTITYEALAKSPDFEMKKIINDFLNINIEVNFEEYYNPTYVNHTISGNIMRFGVREIKLDEKFAQKMNKSSFFLSRAITFPFRKYIWKDS